MKLSLGKLRLGYQNNSFVWAGIFFLLIAVFWFSFLYKTGLLFSGFKVTDDHGIIQINEDLNHNNLFTVISAEIQKDLSIRLRPVYFIHRVIQTKLLGLNPVLWESYNGLLYALSATVLFLFASLIGFSPLEAAIFSLFTFTGMQTNIWWFLGPAEMIGMVFLSLSLLTTALSALSSSKKNYYLYETLFILFTILFSLSKESFIFLIPALLFFKIWFFKKQKELPWLIAVKTNIFPIFLLITISLFELWVSSRAGYSAHVKFNSFDIYKFIFTLFSFVFRTSFWIILISIPVIIIAKIKEIKNPENFKPFIKKAAPPIFIFILILVPQSILYIKSGLEHRYINPGILAFSLIAALTYKYSKKINQPVKIIVLSLIFLSIGQKIYMMGNEPPYFVKEGKDFKSMLTFTKENTNPEDTIVILGNAYAYEPVISVTSFLTTLYDRKNLYYFFPVSATYEDNLKNLHNGLMTRFSKNILSEFNDFKDIKVFIIIFPNTFGKEYALNIDKFFVSKNYNKRYFKYFWVYTINK